MSEEKENKDTQEVPKKRRYRKDKPWDTDDVNHWEVVKINPEDVKGPFLEESSFATLFPKYREKYLKEMWPHVTSTLAKHHIDCSLDLIEGSMTVKTTRKTYDPYIILKARDLLKLLARSVPLQQAAKILEDEMACDIVKIGNLVKNKEKFLKRRQRLLGPSGNTLKAIELLTECYMLVQGNTVAVMGGYKGLKLCRRIIEDCMKNIHPIYHIKELMIKRELSNDEKLKGENWDRFLPHFKKKAAPKRKKTEETKKKEYTPFPPQQTPRKVDLEIETGEYFLKPGEKKWREMQKKKEAQVEAVEKKKAERAKAFVPPKEEPLPQKKTQENAHSVSIEDLKKKFQKQGEEAKKRLRESDSVENYIFKKKK